MSLNLPVVDETVELSVVDDVGVVVRTVVLLFSVVDFSVVDFSLVVEVSVVLEGSVLCLCNNISFEWCLWEQKKSFHHRRETLDCTCCGRDGRGRNGCRLGCGRADSS